MSKNHENLREHIHTLINQGLILYQESRYQEATEYLSQAQYLASRSSFADEELQALISLSACARVSGDIVKGISLSESALKIACKLGDFEAQGKCLLNLGVFHRGRDYERAIQYSRDARTAYERANNHIGIAQSLDNIGIIYKELGALRSAANYMDKARKEFETANEPVELAKCLMNFGDLLTDMTKQGLEDPTTTLPRARKQFNRALSIFEENRSQVDAALCLDSMGLLDSYEGDIDNAIRQHQKAAEIFQRYGAISNLSRALLNLGNAYIRRGDYESASQAYASARRLKKQMNDVAGYARICNSEGVAMNTYGRYADALRILKEAIQNWDELLKKIKDEEFYAEFAESSYVSWTEYLYALSKQYEAENDEQRFLTLAMELERSKARLLRRQLVEGSSIAWQENPESLQRLRQELESRIRISSAGGKRMELRKKLENKSLTQEEFDERMRELISSAQTEFFELEKTRRGMPDEVPSELNIFSPETVLLEIGRAVEPPIKPVLVFMLDFPSRNTLGFGIMQDKAVSYKSVEIGSDERITLFNRLNELHSIRDAEIFSFEFLETNLRELSNRLGDLLDRGEVLSSLKEENSLIILLPFGNWHLFPWEIAACAGGYLGTQHAVVRNYSATLLNLVRNRGQGKTTIESRLRAQIYCPHPEDLPETDKGTTMVASVLQDAGFDVVSFEKQSATREQFIKKAREDDFCLLHFAGHSDYNFRDSLLSSLCLRSDQNLQGDDGRTTALEIGRRLRFKDAPLIYLSSCESAIAQVHEGDEPFGLVRAFLLSGASSLVLSSWQVCDSSAPDMAKAFYEEILEGNSPAEALRRARLEVSQKAHEGKYPETGDFIHWGPFCVYGDPLASIH